MEGLPFRNFVDGSHLYAFDLNTYWLQQVHVIKQSDESVVSSTTLQDDNELSLPLLANTDYWLEGFIMYGANQSADIRIMFSVPSGAVFDICHNGLRLGHVGGNGVDNLSRSRITQLSSGGTIGGIHATANTSLGVIPLEGRVIVGNTPGDLVFRWAQNTSNATATVVKADSLLVMQRLTV